jgi:hypothetical protein
MIGEFEKYHGVALRALIVTSEFPMRIAKAEREGRISSYLVNDHVAILIKHSSKRLPPWQFTFTPDQLAELEKLRGKQKNVWLALVCGLDGLVSLSGREFARIAGPDDLITPFVRVDRDRGTMYRVFGNAGKLAGAKPNGVTEIVQDAFGNSSAGNES